MIIQLEALCHVNLHTGNSVSVLPVGMRLTSDSWRGPAIHPEGKPAGCLRVRWQSLGARVSKRNC